MRTSVIPKTILAITIFCLSVFSTGCLFAGAFFSDPSPHGRDFTPPSIKPFAWPEFNLEAAVKEANDFETEIKLLAKQRKFDRLETLATEYAASKARFIGGGWRIYSFYSSATVREGDTEEDWKNEFEFLNAWKKSKPESITVRSLLSSRYIEYAWKARGSNYAKEVNDDAWELFHRRLEQADEELQEAAKLEARCHLFFTVGMELSRALNKGDKASETAFNRAIYFDPDYYYYYRDHAVSLLPRWGGYPGEWEAFAEKTKTSIGGRKGLQLYYQIVSGVSGLHFNNFFLENDVSWEDAREGYRLIVEEYGTSPFHFNSFAKLSLSAQDIPTFCTAVPRIKSTDDFVPEVWHGQIPSQKGLQSLATQLCR